MDKEILPKSFWKRLEMFVSNVDVNDAMSEEEKEMILRTCKSLNTTETSKELSNQKEVQKHHLTEMMKESEQAGEYDQKEVKEECEGCKRNKGNKEEIVYTCNCNVPPK